MREAYAKVDELVQARLDEAWEEKTGAQTAKYSGAKELIKSMLAADPAKRAKLEVLTQQELLEARTTHVTDGGACSRHLLLADTPARPGNEHGSGIETASSRTASRGKIIRNIPMSSGREIRPAASIQEIEELIKGKQDATEGLAQIGISPQILHFAGHGENYRKMATSAS